MVSPGTAARGGLVAWASRLRFPVLLAIAAVLFVVDLAVPDVIPFVDEIFLGLMTALFASWKRRGSDEVDADDD